MLKSVHSLAIWMPVGSNSLGTNTLLVPEYQKLRSVPPRPIVVALMIYYSLYYLLFIACVCHKHSFCFYSLCVLLYDFHNK